MINLGGLWIRGRKREDEGRKGRYEEFMEGWTRGGRGVEGRRGGFGK